MAYAEWAEVDWAVIEVKLTTSSKWKDLKRQAQCDVTCDIPYLWINHGSIGPVTSQSTALNMWHTCFVLIVSAVSLMHGDLFLPKLSIKLSGLSHKPLLMSLFVNEAPSRFLLLSISRLMHPRRSLRRSLRHKNGWHQRKNYVRFWDYLHQNERKTNFRAKERHLQQLVTITSVEVERKWL